MSAGMWVRGVVVMAWCCTGGGGGRGWGNDGDGGGVGGGKRCATHAVHEEVWRRGGGWAAGIVREC